MTQNRNKVIELFIGNIANSVTHIILEKAINQEIIRNHYNKEFKLSLEIAKKYRAKINPVNRALPYKDIKEIENRIKKKVGIELQKRINKGYENIDLELIEPIISKILKQTKIKEQQL